MSTSAIITLKKEEAQQNEKLKALTEDRKKVIESGDRARREVESQKRHVDELQAAILMLEKAHVAEQKACEVSR